MSDKLYTEQVCAAVTKSYLYAGCAGFEFLLGIGCAEYGLP
jgi:hypothetical protein